MTVRTSALAILLAMISNAAIGQTIERMEISEIGIYELAVRKTTSEPGTATGTRLDVSGEKLIAATDVVPAEPGVHFGFRYRIVGRGPEVRIKIVVLVPQPGIQNPETGNTTVRQEHFIQAAVERRVYLGYTFDKSWEIVPGIWTFECWDGDRKLASQSFNIVKQ